VTAPITLTDYGKLRGVSHVAVSKAVKSGRLHECVGRDERGRPTIIDVAIADREWEANTKTRIGQPDTRVPRATSDVPPVASNDPRPSSGLPAGVPNYNVSQAVRAAASARREAAQAELAELELAERRKAVIPTDVAREDVTRAYSLVKTRIGAVPAAVGQRLPDLAAVVVPVVDELLRAALEELSGGTQ
jgi:hypothetical protein